MAFLLCFKQKGAWHFFLPVLFFTSFIILAASCSVTGTAAAIPISAVEEALGGIKGNGAQDYTVAFRDGNNLLLRLPVVVSNDNSRVLMVPDFKTGTGETIPKKQGYVFTGWNDALHGNGEFFMENSPLPDGKNSLVLYAQWSVSTREITIYYQLRSTLNEVKNALLNANSVYNDEIIIGSGAFSGGEMQAEKTAFMNNLNEKIDEAELLLMGIVRMIPVTNVEKPNGETGIELIAYYEYDYDAMDAIKKEIETLMQNELFDPGNFYPSSQIMDQPKIYSVTVTSTGYYDIELYGASGGHIWSKNDKTALGGLGGYTRGTIKLNAGTVLKFRVGGEGKGTAKYEGVEFNKIIDYTNDRAGRYEGAHEGGFNGGGSGGASASDYAGGSGGGGATDVRIKQGTEGRYKNGVNNWSFDTYNDIDLRIMVAAGGGGAAQSANISVNNWPGLAGGNAGSSGFLRNNLPGPRAGDNMELLPNTYSDGSVSSGSIKGIGGAGNKGVPSEGTGGGGGGYYGGESLSTISSTAYTASGAGGSNYISNEFTEKTQTAPQNAPVRFGNGMALIRWSAKNTSK
ncbi:MAG: hypothetical protein Pg6A_01160 [Termitinemataceae bacterium]|nr:MAG: hypothetical protein Pg6A_01160 [Termitinemataceae bacterium]